MEYQIPSEFDLIIVGTGMVESIVSAAASRIGKKVLHIDSNNYYGGLFASFNLETVSHEIEKSKTLSHKNIELLEGKEKIIEVGNKLFNLGKIQTKWHIIEKNIEPKLELSNEEKGKNDEDTQEVEKEDKIKSIQIYTQAEIQNLSRKFNLDICPKIQYAKGDFIELLISSNIARYSEYRSVSRVLTLLNNQLEVVPCSRSDIFANNKVSVIEKRMLMKLLTTLNENNDNITEYTSKTYKQFLTDKKLSSNLIHYVLYAISNSNDDTPCSEGIENTKKFLTSLGRFGKTPFLFSMYGSGELPQQFCRLSAVFGGIYALNQPLNGLILDENNKFKSLICGSQRINAEHLVIGLDQAPECMVKNLKRNFLSRAIFITDKSILHSDNEHLTLLFYPPMKGQHASVVIELGTLSGCCPKDLFVLHITSEQITNPESDLKHCVEDLLSENNEVPNKPNILWSSYFSIPVVNEEIKNESNIYLSGGPDSSLDYDMCILKAKNIFDSIYPETEFLPRAPDPEEIVFEGEETQENTFVEENLNTEEILEKNERKNIPEVTDQVSAEIETITNKLEKNLVQ